MKSEMIEYAKSFLTTPYQYAANGGGALDCSGLICEILKAFGMLPPTRDYSAQMLYDKLTDEYGGTSSIEAESILFFGENEQSITHVAMAINDWQMIEAGGGDSTTINMAESKKRGAMVRIRPLNARFDLVASIKLSDY